ncbi:MAG: CHASE2 domain-containing protein [Burkholderiales bacterium]|nr:CHASE2 domain-containing protein [Anaerolineae bacterium]
MAATFFKTQLWQQVRIGALLGAACAVIVLLLWSTNLFAQVRLRLNSVYFVPSAVSGSVVIVAIDDTTFAANGRSLTEWPRSLYADFINEMTAAQARVIAFDLLFADPSADDETFAEALVAARTSETRTRMVMSALGLQRAENADMGADDQMLQFDSALSPTSDLASAVDYLGYVNVYPDVDGVIRRQPSLLEIAGEVNLSFSLATYLAYLRIPASAASQVLVTGDGSLQVASERVIPVDDAGFWVQNYFGPPFQPATATFPVVSFQDVISGEVDSGVFADKIVLVGVMNAGGSLDQYAVPSGDRGQRMSGVEIHANSIETLLQNRFLHEQSPLSQALMIVGLAVLSSIIYAQVRWYWMLPVALALVVGWLALVFTLYSARLELINLLHSVLALTLPVLANVGWKINAEIQRRQKSDYLLESVVAVSNQQLALPKILAYIAADVQRLLPASNGGIWLAQAEADDETRTLKLAHRWPPQTPTAHTLGVLSERVQRDKQLVADGAAGQVGIPIVWKQAMIGVIATQSAPAQKPRAAAFNLLREMAERIAPSLENAILHSHIQRQKTLLEAILAGSPTGIMVLDHQWLVVSGNAALKDILPLNSAANPSLLTVMHNAKASEEDIYRLQQSFKRGEPFRQEMQLETTTYSIDGAPLIEFEQWVLIFNDVTVLAELNKLKTRMMRLASHDLKNPLARVIGYADLLIDNNNEEAPLSERNRQHVQRIINAGDEMKNLINDILNTDQISSTTFERVQVDMRMVVEGVIVNYQPTMQSRRQKFTYEIADQLPPVLGNQRYLTQVVSNLISNATKYTPEGGRITLRLYKIEDLIRLEVEDNGYGMSSEDQKGLFREFYRVRNSATANITGTGLGLSLVKWIIEAHSGRIWVKSENGTGSTFYVELPAIQETQHVDAT